MKAPSILGAWSNPDCSRCRSPAFVRKETVVKAGVTIESFYCGRCDHSWDENGDGDRSATYREVDRPDRSRFTPRKPT